MFSVFLLSRFFPFGFEYAQVSHMWSGDGWGGGEGSQSFTQPPYFLLELSCCSPFPASFTARFLKRAAIAHLLLLLASSPTTKLKQFRLNWEVASILPTPWAFYMTRQTWSSLMSYLLISLVSCVVSRVSLFSYQLYMKGSKLNCLFTSVIWASDLGLHLPSLILPSYLDVQKYLKLLCPEPNWTFSS